MKNEIMSFADIIDGIGDDQVKWNKPDPEKQTLFSLICGV